MRMFRAAEKYFRLMQDMYDSSVTVVRCVVGVMAVGRHQRSDLSPSLFSMVMIRLNHEVRQGST